MDKIILENFKIFKGEKIFYLNNLNILTGPNNAGKSTLMKAISLFAKGLEKGDFPSIDLFKTNSGTFKDLVNWNADTNNFKIGFFIELGKEKIPFKVMYEFSDTDSEHPLSTAFVNFKIFDSSNKVLLEVFNKHTTDNEIEEKSILNMFCDDRPDLFLKINPIIAKKHINLICLNNYEDLLTYNGNSDIHFEIPLGKGFPDTSLISINELISSLLLSGNKSINPDFIEELIEDLFCKKDFKTIENYILDYNIKLKKLEFYNFIIDFVKPLLSLVKEGLENFENDNFIQVIPENYNNRVIILNSDNSYLFTVWQGYRIDYPGLDFTLDVFDYYSEEALSIFDINGNIEISPVSNNAIEIYLVDKDKKQNIVDLGKGVAGIVDLIIKTYYSLILYKKDGNRKKVILIEEPETFLHPKWQSKLADFIVFLMNYSNTNIQLIIETHSEYLIRKLQYLTAKKEIKPEDTRIYYFHDPNNIPKGEKQIKELTIREDGMMDDDFGPGFFDESTRLTMDLLKLQSRN